MEASVMVDRQVKPKLITLRQHRDKFQSDKAAAADLGADYMTYRRWLGVGIGKGKRIYSPGGSAWRRLAEAKGVDLPRRP